MSDKRRGLFADVVSTQEYYPFGMGMPGRGFSSGGYRYGFNGKENDNEVKGEGNQIAFEARVYDPRVGRFLSLDPLANSYPNNSPYIFAANNPITLVDALGMWPDWPSWLSYPNHAPSNTWERIQYSFYKTVQFVQEKTPYVVGGWTEAGRMRGKEVLNSGISSGLGSMNGLIGQGSFGLLKRSPESLGINGGYADYFDVSTRVWELAPIPGGSGGAGIAPGLSMASSGGVITAKAVSLEIKNVSIVLANTANSQNSGIATKKWTIG